MLRQHPVGLVCDYLALGLREKYPDHPPTKPINYSRPILATDIANIKPKVETLDSIIR